MERKIVFFDIDGTLITEKTHRLPVSAVEALQTARKNGHLMFINTGRTRFNLDPRLVAIGFDGFVCGCGTNIYADGKELLYKQPTAARGEEIIELAHDCHLDILMEGREHVYFDWDYMVSKECKELFARFQERDIEPLNWAEETAPVYEKFVTWTRSDSDLPRFLSGVSHDFDYIDRGQLSEFVPCGHSKATGIQFILDYYGLPLSAAYAIGDSNNDLSMLEYVPGSIAMGNCNPPSLRDKVWFVTKSVEEDGIAYALQHIGVI